MKRKLIPILVLLLMSFLVSCQSKINKIIKDFYSSDEAVRQTAITEAAKLQPESIENLIAFFNLEPKDIGVNEKELKFEMRANAKQCAVKALVQIGEPAVDQLIQEFSKQKYASGNDLYVLKLIQEALVRIGDERLIPFFIETAKAYPNDNRASVALIALGSLGGEEAWKTIEQVYEKAREYWKSEEPTYYSGVEWTDEGCLLEALGNSSDSRAADLLVDIVGNEGWGWDAVCDYAILQLGRTGDYSRCIKPLYDLIVTKTKPGTMNVMGVDEAKKALNDIYFREFNGVIDKCLNSTLKKSSGAAHEYGKMIIIDKEKNTLDINVIKVLPWDLIAVNPEEVKTVVLTEWHTKSAGAVYNGGSTYGYRHACDVTVIDAEKMEIIGDPVTFSGSLPVYAVTSGSGVNSDYPVYEIAEYLENLHNE